MTADSSWVLDSCARPRVFICYRRTDSEAYAGRLYDHLAGVFGSDRLFLDVEAVTPGEDFVTAIERAVQAVDAVVAVIGPSWTTSMGSDGSRLLDNARDFVRLELSTALRRGVRVIPVLVGGARMPATENLPPDLHQLSRLSALEISHARFSTDATRLIECLGGTPPPPVAGWRRLRAGALASTVRSRTAWAVRGKWLWRLTAAETAGIPSALALIVFLPYQLFYVVIWAFLAFGITGVLLALNAEHRGGAAVARFGWTIGVVSTVIWGAGLLFPPSLGLEPIIESWVFGIGVRLFALACGVTALFLGIGALSAIRRASSRD